MRISKSICFITFLLLLSACAVDYDNVYVREVIDGDTIRLFNREKVRLIGIDCPELYHSDKLNREIETVEKVNGLILNEVKDLKITQRYHSRSLANARDGSVEKVFQRSQIQAEGKLAYEFTRNLVEGKIVRMEFDEEISDQHGRILAYVYLEDGTFVNAEILKAGYASVFNKEPNMKYADLFSDLYLKARLNKKGLWSKAAKR